MTRAWGYLLAIVFAGTAVVGTAAARSIPAFSGRAAGGDLDACFDVDFFNGRLTNICADTQIFEIPLHADSNGSKTVDVAVLAPDTGATACRSVGISRTGTNFTASQFTHPSVANTPTSIILTGAVQVPKGLIFVDCDVGTGAALIQVDWNN